MNNEEIIKMLNHIENLLIDKKYEEFVEYIKRKKIELLKSEEDPTSKYMDTLVKELK